MNTTRAVLLTGIALLILVCAMAVSPVEATVCLTCPRTTDGVMTGGGSVFTGEDDLWVPAGTRLTHGFELHCNPAERGNNLQVDVHLPNGDGGRFHLDELQFAWCWDDPAIEAKPRTAPFDVYFGRGVGRYNGEPGFCADWQFSDAGEPGASDRVMSMRIWKAPAGATCDHAEFFLFSVYLQPGHLLTYGNHQAHARRTQR